MRSRIHSRSRPLAVAAVVAVVLAVSCGEIRESEMLCEEAVSRVDECCPETDPRRFNCIHQTGCGRELYPVFSTAASDCLRDRPCDVLRERGICDGLRQLSYQPYSFQDRSDFEEEACR